MDGLGDTIYSRTVLKKYRHRGGIYVSTSWPQLYVDMPHIKPVAPVNLRLRTQQKNVSRSTGYHVLPYGATKIKWRYPSNEFSILRNLSEQLKLHPRSFDMSGPPTKPDPRIPDVPYMIVRPATIRAEWRADARNARPDYIAQAAQAAMDAGYRVISIADLEAGKEWAVDPLPPAHVRYHEGELGIDALMTLFNHAAGVIGGVGWIVPMAMAYRTPMMLIYGGWGYHNGPHRIFDERVDISHIRQVMPDNFCRCAKSDHDCDKTITNLERHIDRFLTQISTGTLR